jgi:two-component system, LytTR family, response regulator LytT
MNTVIIEDEGVALRKLRKLLLEVNPSVVIVAELESVQEAREWFQMNVQTPVDIILSDIQLSDGLSFEIFEEIKTNLPVIFTTAYDEYTLRAFKLNGIDYLLKPILKEELSRALDKFTQTKKMYSQDHLSELHKLINDIRYKPTLLPGFISYSKGKLIPVRSESVICFYLRNQTVYAYSDNAEYPLEETLDQIESRLPKDRFFRANRQIIIQRNHIANAEVYFNNRLLVRLDSKFSEKIIISRDKAPLFKDWLRVTGIAIFEL